MKNYIYVLFLVMFNDLYCQNIVVIDSISQKPIPFVNIQFNKNTGTYTNENGFFEVNKKSKDTLRLTHIAYKTYEIKVSEVKNTIILSPNTILLKEVKITKDKQIIKYIDFPKKTNNIGSWPVGSKSELVSLIIPSKENLGSIIYKLYFNFVKRTEKNINLSNHTAIRVNIYTANKNNKVEEKIYSSKVIIINQKKNEKIELNLMGEQIEFNKDGLFLGLEVIGGIDDLGNIIKDNSYISAALADNTIEDYSSKTYLKYVFDRKLNLIPINYIIKETSEQTINRNLSFGMEISKPN